MKRVIFLLVVGVLLAPSVFAWDCNNRVQYNSLGLPWEYVINRLETADDSTCWTKDDTITWDSTYSLWKFTVYYQQQATRVVTIGSGSTTNLIAQCNIDFYDPTASWWNFIGIDVDVNHNGSHSYYTVYSNRGNSGNPNDSGSKYTYFNAQSGDTVTLLVSGANTSSGSGTRVQFGGCYIWQYP